jgi:hypothetical protein
MNSPIDYKEGNHNEFIHYLFSSEPKPRDTIQLELPNDDETKNIYHHVFEQLLMIFVDGLKYFYGDSEGKVSIGQLSEQDIDKMNLYFQSMNYKIYLSIYPTIFEYEFKYPDYFKSPDKINHLTTLDDFFYEIFIDQNKVYRIQFNRL